MEEASIVDMKPRPYEIAEALRDTPDMDEFDRAIQLPYSRMLEVADFAVLDCFRSQVSNAGDRNLLLL
jgi:hypothetical protein